MRNVSEESEVARLCREFAEGGHFPRYLLGRTPPYATSVPAAVDGCLDGIVDEFTNEDISMGLPVVHSFAEYDELEARMADGESEEVLWRIVSFRLTGDIGAMDVFTPREKEQYFKSFLDLGQHHSFVDVGGFGGFTSAEFAKRFPDWRKIWSFEPEER